MKRFLVGLAASLMLIATLAGPAAAAGPGCSDFGAASAAGGQAGGFGQFIASLAPRNDLLGPGTRISDIVAWEHSTMCTHP
jgi:hypothetical protein